MSDENKPLPDIMLDLETLGVEPNAMIVQIGACRFDPFRGETGFISSPEGSFSFNVEVNTDDGVIEPATMLWWMRQSDDARRRVFSPSVIHGRIAQGLISLVDWVARQGRFERVWANSPSFDLRLLKDGWRTHHPRLFGIPSTWPFRHNQERDFRTLRKLGDSLGIPEPVRVGVTHDALDDAFHQAAHTIAILRHLAATTKVDPERPAKVAAWVHGAAELIDTPWARRGGIDEAIKLFGVPTRDLAPAMIALGGREPAAPAPDQAAPGSGG